MPQRDYYVYLHVRPDTGAVFYIGKGRRRRAYDNFNRNSYWKKIVAKNNGSFSVVIVSRLMSDDEAKKMEKILIAHHGRKNLCNLTDGGEGTAGWVPSPETRRKISASNVGRTMSDETKRKLREANLGKVKGPCSDQTRRKISIVNSGSGNGMYGRKITESAKELQRKKLRGAQNYLAKPILNTETGIYYDTLQESADSAGMKRGTFWAQISGRNRNKTYCRYA